MAPEDFSAIESLGKMLQVDKGKSEPLSEMIVEAHS